MRRIGLGFMQVYKKYTTRSFVLGAFMLLGLMLFCCIFPVKMAYSATELYPFSNDGERERFMQLQNEIRCVVCQNQSLAESNAPLAQDLKQKIAEKIRAGEDNPTILSFLEERYGPFVSYRPSVNRATLLLWLVPILVLGFGVIKVVNVRM